MEISSAFWLPDITDERRQQEEMHSKYADLSNVACDIFSGTPHVVGVEASFSFGGDVIGWRQSKTTRKCLREKVVVKQFGPTINELLAGDDIVLDTNSSECNMKMKREAQEKKLHRMAKVHNVLEIWQGSQHLQARQKESRAQNQQMTAVGYISDSAEIVKASWSNIQHDAAAAFKLSERSPVPPAISAKDLPGGQTQVLNVRQIKQIDHPSAECEEDSSPESISDTEDWLN